MARFLLAACGLVVLALVPTEARAQDPQQAQTPPEDLVFEREVFLYPTVARRNPFRPLLAADEGGPRFEQLALRGVIHSDEPGGSVAILGASQAIQTAEGVRTAWYLRVGQSLGNVRIVEIQREQIVVEVEEFGLTEQRIMQLARPSGGNP